MSDLRDDPRSASNAPALSKLDAAEVRRLLRELGLTLPRILLTPKEAAEALAISERRLWELTNHGEIASVRNGRAVRYRVESLRRWAEMNERSGITK